MLEATKVTSPEEKTLRDDLERHFSECPEILFAGVGGSPEEAMTITLGTKRPSLVAALLPNILKPVEDKLEGRNYKIVIVRGRSRARG
jgi:hypothetical protein